MVTDPTVIGDMKRYPSLMKEYKDLGQMVEVFGRYRKLVNDIDAAKEIIEDEVER